MTGWIQTTEHEQMIDARDLDLPTGTDPTLPCPVCLETLEDPCSDCARLTWRRRYGLGHLLFWDTTCGRCGTRFVILADYRPDRGGSNAEDEQ